jgi:eukaryotic-like serine/threonine-protein kinase
MSDNRFFFESLVGETVEKFHLEKLLGHGAYGGVYRVREVALGQAIGKPKALKLILLQGQSREIQLKQLAELNAGSILEHDHLLRYDHCGECEWQGNQLLYILMELADSSLQKYLENQPEPDVVELRRILQHTADVLMYLHQQGYTHRDIKPANILWFKHRQCWKIGDLGLVTELNQQEAFSTFGLGTIPYMPPDAFETTEEGKTPLSSGWDIWALGITLIVLWTKSIPYQYRTEMQLIGAVVKNRLQMPIDLPEPLNRIAAGCLQPEPERRWTAVRVLDALQPRGTEPAKSYAAAAAPSPAVTSKLLKLDLPQGKFIELVPIPAGSFMMGSNEYVDEKPIHKVTLGGFWMGKYPVTQEQYESVMGKNPSHFEGVTRPVEGVSWNDAVAFCKKLSERTGQLVSLPSEAQWEYACRADSTTKYCFGDDEVFLGGLFSDKRLEKYAWFVENSDWSTHPVGEKKANAWGLYDMHGNVWEWCLDPWHENYTGAPEDGSAWVSGGDADHRLLRGGSWFRSPRDCRSANRNRDLPDLRNIYIGFRVVIFFP